MWELSTRELAVAIWSAGFLVLAISIPGVRRSLPGIVKALVQPKILGPLLLFLGYLAGVVRILQIVGFWEPSLLKDTILWFLLAGVVIPFTLVQKGTEETLVRLLVVDNLKVLVLLEFLVNFYTFSLIAELILVPVITVLTVMDVVAERKPEYARVSKLIKGVQAVAGLTILAYAVWEVVGDYQAMASPQNLRQWTLPAVLSLAFVPPAFVFLVWAAYDDLFVRLTIGSEKSANYLRRAKLRLVKHLGFKPERIQEFTRRHGLALSRARSIDELQQILRERGEIPNE